MEANWDTEYVTEGKLSSTGKLILALDLVVLVSNKDI